MAHGLEEVLGKSTGERSPGLHISELYNDLFSDLEPTRFIRGSMPDPLRLEMGLRLEEMLERELKAKWGSAFERPPEQMTDCGIAYSPDLLIFDDTIGLIVGEIKLTWLSSADVPREPSNNLPPKFQKYLVQIRAYAYHLRTTHARLFVYFVNGNYRPPVPELLCWDIEFTQAELNECWQMLQNHGRAKGLL